MSYDIETRAPTGSNVHAVVRNSSALIWSNTANAFVTYVAANWANYLVPLTEQSNSGFFYASMPSGITIADTLSVELWSGPGVSEAGDSYITGGYIQWNGTGNVNNITGSSLTSLSYVKDYGQITVNTYDTFLSNRIVAASTAIESYCNRTFAVNNYVEYYDGAGSTEILLNQWPVTGVTQIIADVYGTTPTTIPSTEFVINTKNGIVSIKPSSTYSSWFGYGNQNYQVTYTAGYNPIPNDLQEACAAIVMNQFYKIGTDVTLAVEKIGDYQRTSRTDVQRLITEDIKTTLNRYRMGTI
jgi:hypothetical protein